MCISRCRWAAWVLLLVGCSAEVEDGRSTAALAGDRDQAPEAFARSFGLVNNARVEALARGRGGAIAVAGSATGPQDIGAGTAGTRNVPLMSAFVIGFGPAGEPRFNSFFPYATFGAVAVDDAGDTLVTGQVRGSTTFAEITTSGAGAYVARIDPEGRLRSVQTFPGKGAAGTAIAVDEAGDVIVGGVFREEITIGTDHLTGAGNVFLAKLRPSGEVAWATSFRGETPQRLRQIAIDSAGRAAIGGVFSDEMGLGSARLKSNGGTDAFVAAVEPDGRVAWARSYGGPGDDDPPHVALAQDGSVLAAGTFHGTIDPGSGPISARPHDRVYVACFAPDGHPRWAVPLSIAEHAEIAGIAVAPAGDVHVAGTVTGLDYEAYEMPFLATLDGEGRPRKITMFPARVAGAIHGIALDPSGDVILAGQFHPSIALGASVLRGAGSNNLFLARIAP